MFEEILPKKTKTIPTLIVTDSKVMSLQKYKLSLCLLGSEFYQ